MPRKIGLIIKNGTDTADYDFIGVRAKPALGGSGPVVPPDPSTNMMSFIFSESKELDAPNPERGWYVDFECKVSGSSANWAGDPFPLVSDFSEDAFDDKRPQLTMTLIQVDLGLRRTTALSAAEVQSIRTGLQNARMLGYGVIFRFEYDVDGVTDVEETTVNDRAEPPDTSLNMATIFSHLDQILPVVSEFHDIIFQLQLGILGAWGEYHTSAYSGSPSSSTNPTPNRVEYDPVMPYFQRMIWNKIYPMLPEGMFVGFRRPAYIRNAANETITNNSDAPLTDAPLTTAEAFSGSRKAVASLYNDALYADEGDYDTWSVGSASSLNREANLAYLEQHAKYVPVVAEIDENNTEYNGTETMVGGSINVDTNAFFIANRINLDCLNVSWAGPGDIGGNTSPYDTWRNSHGYSPNYGVDNDYDYATLKMGYRMILQQLDVTEEASQGGAIEVNIALKNDGWGRILKKKQFEIMLRQGNTTIGPLIIRKPDLSAEEDVRRWSKGTTRALKYYFKLPANIATGSWDVYLGITPSFPTLRGATASASSGRIDHWSVRFMSTGTSNGVTFAYDETPGSPTLGYNRIAKFNVVADGSASGFNFEQMVST